MKILHISDIHIGCHYISPKDIFSKRLLGFINYKIKRQHLFPEVNREKLLKKLLKLDWELCLITGDVTNLSTEYEFEKAFQYLEPLFEKGKVIIFPGNHDRYVTSSTNPDLMTKYLGEYMPKWKMEEDGGYFFMTPDEHSVIVGFDMTLPQPFYNSQGHISYSLLEKCAVDLNLNYPDKQRIAVGHYPVWIPKGVKHGFFHELENKEIFSDFLLKNHFQLYLHGHLHKSWKHKPFTDNPITMVNSGGCIRNDSGKWAGFHRIILKGDHIKVEREYLEN